MCARQIADVDVVADAGAVGRWIVGAEYVYIQPLAERGLAGDLDQMRRLWGRLSGASLWVGAGDVEIAQYHEAQPIGLAGVVQHDLRHQLRRAVRRDWRGCGIFAYWDMLWIAIDGGGGRKYELLHTRFGRDLEQGAGIHRIVAIIAKRIAHRIRHNDRGGEMDDGVNAVALNRLGHQLAVASVSGHERNRAGNQEAEAGRQVVEHHYGFAGVDELMHHVAPNIARSASNQNCHARAS